MLYFDHSASTPIHPAVLKLLQETELNHFGNPSSAHQFGQKSRLAIEIARKQMAEAIGCLSSEIIFTGGGTEANNLVLWNLLHQQKKHVITSEIEHPSVLNVLKQLKEFGVTSTIIPVDHTCRVNPEDIQNAITENTGLISIMFANNEVGTVQPIERIGKIAEQNGIPFHSDAVQILGKIPINISDQKITMVSFSAHKFYGPKGVGVLYLKKGTNPKSLIIGGGQETNLRAGTENTSCIAGLGLASELANKNIAKRKTHLEQLADQFKLEMTDAYPEIIYNGHPEHSLPGVISATFPSVTSNILIIKLDLQGIAVSSGSACSSGSVNTSHVLRAMNMSNDHNIRTLRISFGRDNSKEDVQLLTEKISEILKQHHNKR